jgi:DUF4097 and DUF4098 domain-containing protein YvlB
MSRGWMVCVLALVAFATPALADEWKKSYEVSGRPSLELIAHQGRVRVEPWDRNTVEVVIATRGGKIGVGGLRVIDQSAGDHIRIELRSPHLEFHIGWDLRRIEITVRAPRHIDLDLSTGDGSVTLSGFEGTLEARTGDGNIAADSLGGVIRLTSGDGTIHAERLRGSLEAHTGDGPIRVGGVFDAVAVSSGDGTIHLDAAPGSKIGSGWDLHTGDGGMVLRLPADLDADLDAHTGDGRIVLDVPVRVSGTFRGSTVRGALGRGGAPLRLRSGDGSIHIQGW